MALLDLHKEELDQGPAREGILERRRAIAPAGVKGVRLKAGRTNESGAKCCRRKETH